MMLMTFDQFAHIPDKIHIFYEQAFETLFFRHDAIKQAAFRRKMYTNIAINDFKNCLSALCISSYAKEKFSFTEFEILDGIRAAARFAKLNFDERDYLSDLLESVCIIQRDGLFLSFTHRSFQEYFASSFISRSPSISVGPLLDRLCRRVQDSVVSMAFDMNRTLIEREWILPRLRDLTGKLKLLDPEKNVIAFGEITYGQLRIRVDGPRSLLEYRVMKPSDWAPFISALRNLYQSHFALPDDFFLSRAKEDRLAINEELRRRAQESGRRLPEVFHLVDTVRFGEVVLSLSDHEWVKNTSFGEMLTLQYYRLVNLEFVVETSVSQTESMVDKLFE